MVTQATEWHQILEPENAKELSQMERDFWLAESLYSRLREEMEYLTREEK